MATSLSSARPEEVLRRSEKLAAAGRLAATIAHEINNPLELSPISIHLARSVSREFPWRLATCWRKLKPSLGASAILRVRRSASIVTLRVPSSMNLEKLLDEILSVYSGRLQSRNIRVIRDYASRGASRSRAG